MADHNEFHKLLQQITSQPPKSFMSQDEIDQFTREMNVMWLMGDRWLVWVN